MDTLERDRPGVVGLVSDLIAYERLLQTLFAKGGELATAAIIAQVGQKVSPICGHQILTAISNAQLLTSNALGHIAQAHRELETLAQRLGIDIRAFGDVLKPPSASG
ncbi:hypothetical protein [Novosphingobium fluoreni]|uniref:hypothetical protein n=1 Tax=Novosphingobium fluoreni TaxID=1391222 RepID=UPI00161305CF|nr:hypothetical protein [Novosphingobium fluoreni]